MKGPSITKLVDTNELREHDRGHKIGDPIVLPTEHEDLSLDELAKLYPPPATMD